MASNLINKILVNSYKSNNLFRKSRLFSVDFSHLRVQSLCCSSTNAILAKRNKLHVLNKAEHFCTKARQENVASTISGGNTSTFLQMLSFRKKQAHCSVLLELRKKDDVPYALSSCEKFGVIKNAFSYSGVSDNVFLLLEYDKEQSVKELLLNSHYKNILDVFPVMSRIIGYSKKDDLTEPKMAVKVIEETPNGVQMKGGTISDLIENIYLEEKLTELNIRLRFFFCCILKELLAGPFPFCDAIPFGSSINGIGRYGCDLDLMIRLYPEKVKSGSEFCFVNKTCVGDIQNLQRKVVYCIADLLRTFSPGVVAVHKVLHARVPIVKLEHTILGMKVDISVNNLAPILMAELLYFCGEVDSRIRPLIFAVKKWARETNVTYEGPGSWITNFSLTLLVIYFLQNRPMPILPPLKEVVDIIGAECTEEYRLEFLKSLPELQAEACLNKESIAVLLKEFLLFLGSHPFEDKHISILTGKSTDKVSEFAIWIQYPLEEDLNVSKNVSQFELYDMCEKARVSVKYLTSNLNKGGPLVEDLSTLLGTHNIRKLDVNKSKRLDVSSLLGEDVKNVNKKSGRRRAF